MQEAPARLHAVQCEIPFTSLIAQLTKRRCRVACAHSVAPDCIPTQAARKAIECIILDFRRILGVLGRNRLGLQVSGRFNPLRSFSWQHLEAEFFLVADLSQDARISRLRLRQNQASRRKCLGSETQETIPKVP